MADEEKLAERYRLAESLIAEQNFGAGVVAAVVAALAGALAWGVAAAVVGGVPAWFAIGLGALVGYGMQLFGKGLSTKYSIAAALIAVIGCLAGYVVAAIIYEAKGSADTVGDILAKLHMADVVGFFVRELGFLDVFFLFLAAVAAWYFAQRDLTEEQDFAMRAWAERPDPARGYIQ